MGFSPERSRAPAPQVNEIVAASANMTKQLDEILEMYLKIRPRFAICREGASVDKDEWHLGRPSRFWSIIST